MAGMSAQVIAALRRRADAADKRAATLRAADLNSDDARLLTLLSGEFRALADEAEGYDTEVRL
jgi:hypothetical protein